MSDKSKSIRDKAGKTANASSTISNHESRTAWLPHYWVIAVLLPGLFFTFETFTLSLFSATRAPNVDLAAQTLLMLIFYSVWIFVPRSVWALCARTIRAGTTLSPTLVGRLLMAGFVLCGLHLLLLTLILRWMHSPPGWGMTDLLYSYGEIWLSKGATWLLAYGATAALIAKWQTRPPEAIKTISRLLIGQNGKTILVPLQKILWIKSAGNYVEIYTRAGMHMMRKPLSKLEQELATTSFVKSHRSALVNAQYVEAIQPGQDGRGYVVKLGTDCFAPLSRRRVAKFKKIVSQGD